MASNTKANLKDYFRTGDKPTEQDFEEKLNKIIENYDIYQILLYFSNHLLNLSPIYILI